MLSRENRIGLFSAIGSIFAFGALICVFKIFGFLAYFDWFWALALLWMPSALVLAAFALILIAAYAKYYFRLKAEERELGVNFGRGWKGRARGWEYSRKYYSAGAIKARENNDPE